MIAFAWKFKLRKNSGSLCVFSSTSRALFPRKNYAPCLDQTVETKKPDTFYNVVKLDSSIEK